MSGEARARTIGTSMQVSMAVLHADLGLTRTESETRADARWVTERTATLMADGVEWRPGARELVTDVRSAGLATALVTTTPRQWSDIEATIKQLDKMPRQVLIEVLVAEIALTDDTRLGLDWALKEGSFRLGQQAIAPTAPDSFSLVPAVPMTVRAPQRRAI